MQTGQVGRLGPAVGQQRTLSLKFVPRGSTPTTSNRARTSGLSQDVAAAANSTPEPAGPPGLTNRLPIRWAGSVARSLSTATVVFGPFGLS